MRKFWLLAAGAVILAGCAVKPKPPDFNLYTRQRMVVLPFENSTQDPALGKVIQDEVIAGLVQLNAIPVAEQNQVSAIVDKQKQANFALEQDEALRKKIVEAFKADLIMVGAVNSYMEEMTEEEPRRIRTNYKTDTYKWGYSDVVSVKATANVKIIDAYTGNILWMRKSAGEGVMKRWKDLPWPGDNPAPPAEGWTEVKNRGRGEPQKGKPEDKPEAGKQEASSSGGQTINIIVQNVQQQSQAQTQTQSQEQAQTQAAAPQVPKLLYQSDSNVMRARERAISQVIRVILSDYRGRGDWSPPAR